MISVCITTICLVAACIRGSPFTTRRPIDRSLFFCNLCFAISAGLYALSLLLREKVGVFLKLCSLIIEAFQIACTEYNDHHLYAVHGLPNTSCTFIATLLYYFGTAGRLWWLMICVAWRWSMREHSATEMVSLLILVRILITSLILGKI